jgi:hypothetical protein
MENKCNEWECSYNKDGKCILGDCPKLEDFFNERASNV